MTVVENNAPNPLLESMTMDSQLEQDSMPPQLISIQEGQIQKGTDQHTNTENVRF